MKAKNLKYIVVLFVLISIISCNNRKNDGKIHPDLINNPASATEKESDKIAILDFSKTVHDFGEIVDGVKVSYSFKFTNTGKSELIISNCVPSCGCTVPDFPKKPIKPGNSEYISVVFDSKGRTGTFEKTITVYSNTIPNSVVLYIKGSVVTQ